MSKQLSKHKEERKLKVCSWKLYPRRQQSLKSYFFLGQSEGHKVIDLAVIWKGIIIWVFMPNMKPLSLTDQKL